MVWPQNLLSNPLVLTKVGVPRIPRPTSCFHTITQNPMASFNFFLPPNADRHARTKFQCMGSPPSLRLRRQDQARPDSARGEPASFAGRRRVGVGSCVSGLSGRFLRVLWKSTATWPPDFSRRQSASERFRVGCLPKVQFFKRGAQCEAHAAISTPWARPTCRDNLVGMHGPNGRGCVVHENASPWAERRSALGQVCLGRGWCGAWS